MSVLSGLEPKQVFSYFEEICAIPHASYHEEQISDYCVEFAKRHNLTYYQDELKNVIIMKTKSRLLYKGILTWYVKRSRDVQLILKKTGSV